MKILVSQITLSYLIHGINIFLQNKCGFVVELVFRQALLKKSRGMCSGDKEETTILSSYRILGSF